MTFKTKDEYSLLVVGTALFFIFDQNMGTAHSS
jgi:hypothetical protein